MSGTLRVTVLGCGSSGGTPRANGDWGACDPNDPRNRRTRCGLLLQKWRGEAGAAKDATTVLIDTPPELRAQLAEAKPTHLDAVVFSHDHADQVHGIDDVRAFYLSTRKTLPAYMDAATKASLMHRFGYCFEPMAKVYPALMHLAEELQPLRPFTVAGPGGDLELTPLDQDHGFSRSLGFRIGPLGYSNDVKDMPNETFAVLEGMSLWIVDALRERPAPTHAHLGLTLEWIARLKPSHAVLTNLHSELDYATLAAKLPERVEPAYDGWAQDLPL